MRCHFAPLAGGLTERSFGAFVTGIRKLLHASRQPGFGERVIDPVQSKMSHCFDRDLDIVCCHDVMQIIGCNSRLMRLRLDATREGQEYSGKDYSSCHGAELIA